MTNLLAQLPGMVWSLWVMTVVPSQLSVATTAASLGAGTALAHWTVTSAGMPVMTGAVLSLTVMVWIWLLLLPQTSVAVKVRLMTNLLAQLPGMVWSLWVITTAPLQLSAATTPASLGAGTALAHWMLTSAGMPVMTGAVLSFLLIFCV